MAWHGRLPRIAQCYLKSRKASGLTETLVRRFHNWIAQRDMVLAAVRVADVKRFLRRPLRRRLAPSSSEIYGYSLINYFKWLHTKGRIKFDPSKILIRKRRSRSAREIARIELIESYVEYRATTLKKSTIQSLRRSIYRFHDWLSLRQLQLRRLSRDEISQWFIMLNDRGLRPKTRIEQILIVRAYLRWCFERGELRHHSEDLVRPSDFPKPPKYLPRPLDPDHDRELQRRLAASSSQFSQGLLLMRLTGLRVGEVIHLEYACVRTDQNGQRFVKVPLGKLDCERLVPIDDRVYQLIEQFRQGRDPARAKYLLETEPGQATRYEDYRLALLDAASGMVIPDPLTTHRLRHTYATSLLSAGASLASIMKLLGHRDFRMTLRYTAITQPLVLKEYHEALAKLETRYRMPIVRIEPNDPLKNLSDVMRWIQTQAATADGRKKRKAQALLKRITRIREQLRKQTSR